MNSDCKEGESTEIIYFNLIRHVLFMGSRKNLPFLNIYNKRGEEITHTHKTQQHTDSHRHVKCSAFSFSDTLPPDSSTVGRKPTISDTDSIRLLSKLILRRHILQPTSDSSRGCLTDSLVYGAFFFFFLYNQGALFQSPCTLHTEILMLFEHCRQNQLSPGAQ